MVDEAKGPVTRKDYDIVQAPAGDALFGKVVNFFGYERTLSSPPGSMSPSSSSPPLTPPIGMDKVRPLINQQVDMKGREQITECLLTGVKVRGKKGTLEEILNRHCEATTGMVIDAVFKGGGRLLGLFCFALDCEGLKGVSRGDVRGLNADLKGLYCKLFSF